MAIHIGKAYRIIEMRHKRYNAHYHIPSDECLVVPLKEYGNELLCDIRWVDQNGEMQVLHNRMFVADNIAPLNAMLHEKLFEIWSHYYGGRVSDVSSQEADGINATEQTLKLA